MKTHLSEILPVWKASEILGEATVSRMALTLMRLREDPKQQQQHGQKSQLQEEMDVLIKALFFRPQTTAAVDPLEDPTGQFHQEPSVPPHIASLWKRWLSTRSLQLDKQSFKPFLVPQTVQPSSGAGHAGLFDCLVYALQHGTVIWFPDVLIFLAVCKQFQELSPDGPEEESRKVVYTMALLGYRIYDSYLKKASVSRDTVHRFLTDIYGEDSYKKADAVALLDAIFYSPSAASTTSLQATVTESQFCQRCMDTTRNGTSHWLLDWMADLGHAMTPPEKLPDSVTSHLDRSTQQQQQPLCQIYALANHRLYEIKRRFHSMVQSFHGSANSPLVLQGDPMSSSSSQPDLDNQRHNVISEAAFAHDVSTPNEEMGTGGYLPKRVASLVFLSHGKAWGLYQVLHFGCLAVRHTQDDEDRNVPLLRFLFDMFRLDPQASSNEEDEGEVFLTRAQVARMLLVLLECATFRRRADCPPIDLDESAEDAMVSEDESDLEATQVNLETAVLLGLLQPPEGSKPGDFCALKSIVDATTKDLASPDTGMSFGEFCSWHNQPSKNQRPGRLRLGPLIVELRLIAAVQFGIPPTLASMEVALIAEIDRRHKRRYPQSDVSRRGPRGTVWNIIDNSWLKEWTALLDKVAGTQEDAVDGRGDPRNDCVRGLVPIRNTALLVANGSLSLRKDIRWKHDYELLPPLAWSALQAWYDGGPPIHRSVVKYVQGATSPHSTSPAAFPTENEIELYPYFVTVYLCDAASRGEARPFQQNFQLSRVSPILVMLVQLCKELDVNPDAARLWVMGNEPRSTSLGADESERGTEDWILSLETNIAEQRKRRGNKDDSITLLLELKDRETGLWPRGVDGKEWAFRDKSTVEQVPSDLGDGVVGLYNMGNTCYLNSSIQCLSHTPILREYFTSKAFYKDINRTNPLGHEGRLAQVSAVLINELWKRSNHPSPRQSKRITAPQSYLPLPNAPSLTPKTFKESLGKFNDIFAGNEQHDAQELLAFLLGGLSEDLNRIVEKPYMEAPDSDGRPDSELADIWWSNHLKREMSIIVALFTGQYKSLLACRSCKYESARFEPFSFLQLPLPEDEHLQASVTFYPRREGETPMKYSVRVRNDGKLHDVLVGLAKLLHEDEEGNHETGQSGSSESENGDNEELNKILSKRARNMAIVDMREGYIAKMASGDWVLQDQQNKESGELPPLHVYELDPLPERPAKSQVTGEREEETPRHQPSYVTVSQRRSELLCRDFLHPLAHRVFGIPLLFRIDDIAKMSGRDFYDLVAKRLKTIVPKGAVRFLSPSQAQSSQDEGEGPSEAVAEAGRNTRNKFQTTTDMEEVSAGPLPRYGFRLRTTFRDGRRCQSCPWYECCIGCFVPDDDNPISLRDGGNVVVDWHFAVDAATNGFGFNAPTSGTIFPTQSTPTRKRTPTVPIKVHSSCGTGPKKGNQPGAVTLEECLDAFAQEEKIPEAYCSRCQDFRVQTKRMSLWRLPPVMIIHLKRFQFTQTMRRKLRDLVVFPTEGLDLSRIMAPDSVASASKKPVEVNSDADGEKSGELKDDGRSEMLYDLYGVIHHQGALSGGHYVASLKSELDGQWRLFNDAQIFEINARDVVDPSAYILFYIRRDVAKAQLADYWDVREGNGISAEDMDHLLKGRSDRCVIS